MSKQQPKRRRKRYEPGSAYAGKVRPTGVLGFLGSGRMTRVVFIVMALALMAGGAVGFLGYTGFTNSPGNSDDFVIQDPDGESGTPQATQEESYTTLPPMTIDPAKTYVATIRTAEGDIQVQLLDDEAPQTVNNFVFLAQDGFYDGLAFDEVFPGFSVQVGEPDGARPSYELPNEGSDTFTKGTLGMATASSFFIALGDSQTALQQYSEFTPFGQVTSGLDLAERIAQGTRIQGIEITES